MTDFFGQYFGMAISTLGAAIAAGLAGIGSAKGISLAGKAAAGLVSEQPDMFGSTLVLQLLPGTQGVYGLLVAFLILLGNGVVTPLAAPISAAQGWIYFFAGIPVGLVGMTSAMHQGQVCVSGIALIGKRPEMLGRAIMMGIMVETYAVFSLLVSMLIVLLGRAA